MKIIAIDFGGTTIKVALFHNKKIIRKGSIPAYSKDGLQPRLLDTERLVWELLEGDEIAEYSGIGIAMPGIVDPQKKCVTGIYEKYSDSKYIDLEKWCRDTFSLPMFIEMDSKLALLGEVEGGCAKGYQDAVLLILGTGIGTAVMINGRLLDSHNHVAGALSSHIILDMGGAKCTCPNQGCMEASASGWALPELVRQDVDYKKSGLSQEVNIGFYELEKWYLKGDYTAIRVLERCVCVWQTGILNMIHAYDPEVVVLSGAVMQFQGLYEMLREGLEEHIWDCCGKVLIKQAENPSVSVLLGLWFLVMNALNKNVAKENDYEDFR